MSHTCSRTRRKDWLLQNKHLWEGGIVGREEELAFIRLMIKEGLFAPSHLYNVKIDRILEIARNLECRYPKCKGRVHRLGLCNKHRKWVERGHMTEDLQIIKKPFERGIYKDPNARCKIPNCDQVPRRNWMCSRHASQIKMGTIDLQGNPVLKAGKISGRYPSDVSCKVCKRATGRIVLGFCSTHYNQYSKGKRSIDGMSLVRRCKASDCKRRLVKKDRDWCYRHAKGVEQGIYNSFGKRLIEAKIVNQGKVCKTSGCDKPAHCLGMCKLHYTRHKVGYKGPASYKNIGKTCTFFKGCTRPAACRALCSYHYYKWKIPIERKAAIAKSAGYSFVDFGEWSVFKGEFRVTPPRFKTRDQAIEWAYYQVSS